MRNFLEFIAAIVVGTGAFVLVVTLAASYFERQQCEGYRVTGKETQYTGYTCYVKNGSTWQTWAEHKAASGADK